MNAETSIKAMTDRFAKGWQSVKSAYSTGTEFWDIADAASDRTYENRMRGTYSTDLDNGLKNADYATSTFIKTYFSQLNTYLRTDLALTAPYIESYLATKGWRIPYEFAQVWYEATGQRINSKYVFAKGTRPTSTTNPTGYGLHTFQTWVYTGASGVFAIVDGALVNCMSPVVVSSTTAAPGGASHALTLTLSDGSTTKTVTFTPSATQHAHVLVGSQVIGAAGAAAGQKVIPVAATAQFAAATHVLLTKSDYSVSELVLVASLVANTSLTATTNLINSFVQNDLVLPLCVNAVRQAGTLDNDKSIAVYAWPDRIIAL